jgi:hypothetical protein
MTRLPDGQIRPAAQPVASFLEPVRRQIAAPAGPVEIPRVQGIGVIQQASGGSLQGINQFEQMAQALAPFNQRLTELAGTGLTMYASSQVQRGVNEALRAKALLDEQQRQSGREYAAENRRLAQADPVAALMMDTVNPWRRSGRERALVQLAGMEVKPAIIAAYRDQPGVEQLDERDPRLAEIKARAVQSVLKKYGVTEASPGFIQNVLPQINEGSDRMTELHWQDRSAHLKRTVPRTASAEMLGLYVRSLDEGQLEVFAPDGRRQLVKTGDPGWDQARSQVMGATLDRLVEEMGLPGEVATVKQQAIEQLLAIANADGNEELKRLALSIPVGPPDSTGFRQPAAGMFAQEALDSEIKYGEVAYKRQQRRQEELGRSYQDQLIQATYGLPDGPERLRAIEALRNDPKFQELPLSQRLELEQKASGTIDKVVGLGRSMDGVTALLQDMTSRYGSAWNPAQADAEFNIALASAPEDERPKLRAQYADIRQRNNARETAPTTREVNGVIDRAIKANLRVNYPGSVTEAALRGVNTEAIMAGWTDANVAESARRQFSAFQGHVRDRIAAAEGQKGRPLTAAEAIGEATKAIEEYGQKDQDARRYLFPGVNGQQGAGPAQRQQPAGGGGQGGAKPPVLPPGTKPFTGRVYPSSQLDNIPDRAATLNRWRQQPILEPAAVVQEANRILSGGAPSAALRRFARDAGTTPGALLIKQLDFYPGSIQVPAADRQRLLRDGRQAQAARNTAAGAASGNRASAVQRASVAMLDMLLGTKPAMAAPAMRLPSAVGLANRGVSVATNSPLPAGPALSSPTLARLGSGRMVATRPGLCVTAVLDSMKANGVPNPAATGLDAGNNPRGLASQLVRSFSWKPLPGLGQPRTINSPYGAFTANVMSASEYQAAAAAGRVPSGAVVFQTQFDWGGTSSRSRGFDAAIAREGGRTLWNGSAKGPLIYGSATRQVFVLVPGDIGATGNTITSRRR